MCYFYDHVFDLGEHIEVVLEVGGIILVSAWCPHGPKVHLFHVFVSHSCELGGTKYNFRMWEGHVPPSPVKVAPLFLMCGFSVISVI
jgi:hypothetical protein